MHLETDPATSQNLLLVLLHVAASQRSSCDGVSLIPIGWVHAAYAIYLSVWVMHRTCKATDQVSTNKKLIWILAPDHKMDTNHSKN